MRILLGVNEPEHSRGAITLLVRLAFSNATVDVVHVVETLQFPSRRDLPEPVWDSIALAQQRRYEAGAELAEQAASDLKSAGLIAKPRCLRGLAADSLMDYADEMEADLIAIGSRRESPVEAFFTGSVGRGLVIGARHSILVVKQEPASQGPVTAVLATDHSAYMNDCLERLAVMAPQGIGKLIILTVYDINLHDLEDLRRHDADLAAEWARDYEQRLHERNRALCTKLRSLGTVCETRVLDGPPIPAINSVMQSTGAELLILGARGHGVMERLTLGSVSFHQVVAEPHSVLVLRA